MKPDKEKAIILKRFYCNDLPDDTLLTQYEAQIILPLSDSWWEKSRSYGGGPPFKKIGRSVFYTKKSILDFINKHPDQEIT